MTAAAAVSVTETRSPPSTPGRAEESAEQLLAALPNAVGSARRFVRHTLEQWQLDDLTDTAETVIACLVGDAVARTGVGVERPSYADLRGTPVSLLLVRAGIREDRLLIEVHDEDATPPWMRDATTATASPARTIPGARAVTHDMVSSGGTIARVEFDTNPTEQETHTRQPRLPQRVPGQNRQPSSQPVEVERDQDLLERVHIGLRQIPVCRPVMPGMAEGPASGQ